MRIKIIITSLCIAGLTSCMDPGNEAYENYGYTSYQTYSLPRNMQSSYIGSDMRYEYETTQAVDANSNPNTNTSDSYYVGPTHAPVSFKDKDRQWVGSQNPQGYTVEVADDEKPSRVASKLQQLPKTDRMAQVKYQRNGKKYFKGVYGSYESHEDAQKAINTLPADVKEQALIKNWSSVQNNLVE